MREKRTRCLVVGTGIAGLSAAIELADAGNPVTLITAAPDIVECNTSYAQGGIIYQAANGDPSALETDILEAGCHMNYRPAVRQLAVEGPRLVKEILIQKAGVPFDSEAGSYHLTREGGHSEPRILHKGDESGKSIHQSLYEYCRSNSLVEFATHTTAVNLLMSSHHGLERALIQEPARCFGAFVFDQLSGEVYPIFAEHTVLATGGTGQLFLHNTNSKFARGDGIALADRAGCRLENLEYVQFHPTTFYKRKSPRFLISEALRGEGAVLLNESGERFLVRYLPDLATPELAPRDRVARAIHLEMLSSGAECVYLDISHKPEAWIRDRFPFIYRSCLKHGVDITKQPVPVVPGAHYNCGGVWTDLEGRTTVRNLWAAGEVACTGVHGANRLASTSLLEGLVWGTRAGRFIAGELKTTEMPMPQIEPWSSENVQVEPSFLTQDWLTLKHTMWNYVGLIKTAARLSRAEGILRELARGIDVFYRKAKLSDALIGLRHASLVALRVLDSCKANPRSLGCYQREDWEI
jgi:L-aspartate oxidase